MSPDTPPDLPRLRVARRPLNLARIAGLVSAGVRHVDAQREPFARYWDAQNASTTPRAGPLWLALGDSAVQGLGASTPQLGWVPQVLARLRQVDPSWRVVNLSMTGARMFHVYDHQIAAATAAGLEPQLVTCMIGTNDFMAGARAATISRHAQRLVDVLPTGTLLGKIAGPGGRARNRAIREPFRLGAERGAVELFEPYRWPKREGALAADRFHPGDLGYMYIADNAWKAIEPRLG